MLSGKTSDPRSPSRIGVGVDIVASEDWLDLCQKGGGGTLVISASTAGRGKGGLIVVK